MVNAMDRIRQAIHEYYSNNVDEPVVFIDHEVRNRLKSECHLIITPPEDEKEVFTNLMGCDVYVTDNVDGVIVRSEHPYR